MLNIFLAVLFLLFISKNSANKINNGLAEKPSVQCGSEGLTLVFKTLSAFEGHVYVKGHYSLKQCRSDATLEPQVNISVSYSACDVIRQRSSTSKGILMTVTVIISFHPMFITKIDRSYKVQCFYAEISKSITQQLNVNIAKEQEKELFATVEDRNSNDLHQAIDKTRTMNDFSKKNVNNHVVLPECRYKILNEKKNEEVGFASVGQLVYHQWSCEPINEHQTSIFCVTVHSCNVKDESGKEVQIFDENGCAVDKYLISNLDYTSDLVGGQFSQIFKFADQPSVFFQCKIRLGLKENDGICKRSSDNCPVTLRGKRSISSDNNFDVISQTMTILDIDESTKTSQTSFGSEMSHSFANLNVCVTKSTASGFVLTFVFLLLVCFFSLIFVYFRHQTVEVKLVP